MAPCTMANPYKWSFLPRDAKNKQVSFQGPNELRPRAAPMQPVVRPEPVFEDLFLPIFDPTKVAVAFVLG